MVFSGLDLSDLDHMTTEELKDVLPMLRTMDLPFHIGSKIVKKVGHYISLIDYLII